MNQETKQSDARFCADSYGKIASEIFAPLYPYYANIIVERTGVRSGVCLDAGCGGGHLGMAVAERTGMRICFLDSSAQMLELARRNARERGLSGGFDTVEATVESIPLPPEAVDLVVSRGSIPFWSDLTAAFSELFRVLKPGGHAYVGGGLGPMAIRAEIQRAMRDRDAAWRKDRQRNIPQRTVEEYAQALDEAGIGERVIERGDEGTWIRFQKL